MSKRDEITKKEKKKREKTEKDDYLPTKRLSYSHTSHIHIFTFSHFHMATKVIESEEEVVPPIFVVCSRLQTPFLPFLFFPFLYAHPGRSGGMEKCSHHWVL